MSVASCSGTRSWAHALSLPNACAINVVPPGCEQEDVEVGANLLYVPKFGVFAFPLATYIPGVKPWSESESRLRIVDRLRVLLPVPVHDMLDVQVFRPDYFADSFHFCPRMMRTILEACDSLDEAASILRSCADTRHRIQSVLDRKLGAPGSGKLRRQRAVSPWDADVPLVFREEIASEFNP